MYSMWVGCQKYDPFRGTLNIRCRNSYTGDPTRDHNFDNHPDIGTWTLRGMARSECKPVELLVIENLGLSRKKTPRSQYLCI